MADPARQVSSSQFDSAPAAVVDWDPQPTKAAMKTAYGVGITAVSAAAKEPIKAAASKYYPGVPEPVIDFVVEAGVAKVAEGSKKVYDKAVDKAYETPDSLGSRVVRYYQG